MTISLDTPEIRSQIEDSVAMGKREILEDMACGRVPSDIEDFGLLHDHVDANCYGGLCDKYAFTMDWDDGESGTAFGNEVQERLHQWLKRGRPVEKRYDTTPGWDSNGRAMFKVAEIHRGGSGRRTDQADLTEYALTLNDETGEITLTRDDEIVFTDNVQTKSEPEQEKRELLVHLNVEQYTFDTRTPDQIADYLLACIEVGGEGNERSEGLGAIVCPLAEAI